MGYGISAIYRFYVWILILLHRSGGGAYLAEPCFGGQSQVSYLGLSDAVIASEAFGVQPNTVQQESCCAIARVSEALQMYSRYLA